MNQIIYKKDLSGKIRFLQVIVLGDLIQQKSGVLNTPNEIVHEKRAKGKNIGKSNETTPQQQALLEATSLIKEKLSEGYFLTKEEAETIEVILPMLAKEYKKEFRKIKWNNLVFCQPKLDGMRCLAFIKEGKVKLMSRDGKIIQNMQHIEDELSTITTDCILDGELYNIELGSFQSQMRGIKKYRAGITEQINFNVYDCITPINTEFFSRFQELHKIVHSQQFKYLKLVNTYLISSEEALVKRHKEFVEAGYEGTIVRLNNEGYLKNGRSSSLLKYKDFIDEVFTIKDIVPAEQRPDWGKPVFEIDGKEFSAGMRYSHEDRIDFLQNKEQYIGKTAEVRFFEYSEDNIPRHPIMHGIRLDK